MAVRHRRAAGGERRSAILYISHRLAEVRRLCRRGTVLRNGESIGTVDLAGTSDADIFRMMVGTRPDAERGRHVPQVNAADGAAR